MLSSHQSLVIQFMEWSKWAWVWSNAQIHIHKHSWTLQQTFAYVQCSLDNPHTNSRQSSFISTSNIWTTVARSNNSIILNKFNYSGSQNMQMWNTRIILIPYGLKPLSINKTPFIYHHIDYSLFVVSVNQLLTWITTLVPCS